MPVTQKLVRRHRGKEIVFLRRLVKVADEIKHHNQKYPQAPPPAPAVRRHLEFTETEMALLDSLAAKATILVHSQWPPPVT